MKMLLEKHQLIVPCIHLNGTSEADLTDAIEVAHAKLLEAFEFLKKTAPNGRDYYVYDNQSYSIARNQHDSRLLRITEVIEELELVATGIFTRQYVVNDPRKMG